jgi:hypothetical protein
MALGVISGSDSGNNNVYRSKDGSPFEQQHHGKSLPELASYTTGLFVKARHMLSEESGGSSNTVVYRKATAYLYPWRGSTGAFNTYSSNNIMVTSEAGSPRSYGSSFAHSLPYAFGSTDADITSNDATQSDTVAWENQDFRDRWLFIGGTFDYASKTISNYIIDPSDGSVLQERSTLDPSDYSTALHSEVATSAIGDLTWTLQTGYSNYTGGVQSYTDYDLLIAEWSVWQRALTKAELVAYSQVGFAEINAPTDLGFSFNFMRDWSATSGSKQEVFSSVNPADILLSTYTDEQLNYVLDNPVPVYLLNQTSSEPDGIDLSLFSAVNGTAKVSAYPSGTAQPTDADIFNGVGAVSTLTLQPDGLGDVTGTMTGLVTGTEYVLYSVQDELDGGGTYGSVASVTLTTPTKYSENISDVAGTSVGAQTGIQWAWFDSVDPDTLGNPSAQGTAEVTDATGLLEVTLPTTISTAKGSQGTMVLRSDWGGSTQTASHLVEVK